MDEQLAAAAAGQDTDPLRDRAGRGGLPEVPGLHHIIYSFRNITLKSLVVSDSHIVSMFCAVTVLRLCVRVGCQHTKRKEQQ